MSGTSKRRARRAFIAIAIVVGAGVLLHAAATAWLERTLKTRIRTAATAAGAEWVAQERTVIAIGLLSGDLRLTDVRWEPKEATAGPSASGRLDSLVICGLGYRALLFGKRLSAARVVLSVADLDLVLPEDTVQRNSSPRTWNGARIGHLDLRLKNGRVERTGATETALDEFNLQGADVVLDPHTPEFVAASLALKATALRHTPAMDDTLTVQDLVFDGVRGDLTVRGIAFGPADVIVGAKKQPIARDVMAGNIEQIVLSGIDLDGLLHGNVSCRTVRLGPTQLTVARDKVLPDAHFKHKPLPARLLRTLPHGMGADSLVVQQLKVDYHERVDADRGFAHIPFDDISGVVRNLRNAAADTLDVDVNGRLFGATPLTLRLRSHIGDSTDHIIVDARVGRLRFPTLSRVLVPLTGIATTEGRLDTLVLRMHGHDRHATAQCFMRYDGLRLNRQGQEKKLTDPVLNGLLNTVVKRSRTGEKDGDGWMEYTWERRRDRSVFNYLWAGVREGAKATMLPKTVLDQIEEW